METINETDNWGCGSKKQRVHCDERGGLGKEVSTSWHPPTRILRNIEKEESLLNKSFVI